MSPSALDRGRFADDAVVDASRRRRLSLSTTRTVPSIGGPSSSDVISSAIEPGWSGCAATKRFDRRSTNAASERLHVGGAAAVEQAVAARRRERVGMSHSSSGPVGTTSVWPAKHDQRPTRSPRRAQRLVTPLEQIVSQRKPAGAQTRLQELSAARVVGRLRARSRSVRTRGRAWRRPASAVHRHGCAVSGRASRTRASSCELRETCGGVRRRAASRLAGLRACLDARGSASSG